MRELGRLSLAEAFMMPRLRAFLPRDATLEYDGSGIRLPRVNPTPADLAAFRRFIAAAAVMGSVARRFPERRDRVVHYDNKPKS